MLLNDLGRGGKKGAVSKCGTCDGAGLVIRVHQIAPGMMQKIRAPCSDCAGQGEKINPKDKCKTCDGKKIIRERKIIEVHIDKGERRRDLAETADSRRLSCIARYG